MKILEKYKQLPLPLKASLWFVICGLLQKGISFLTVPVFTRLLNTEEFGVYNLFLTWQSLITIFASLNLASGVYLRGLVKYDGDEAFTLSMHRLFILSFFIVFTIYLLFSSQLNAFIGLPTNYMCILFVDLFLQVSIHFWSARKRVEYRYKELVLLSVINAVLQPAIGVFAVLHFQDKVSARLVSILIVDIITYGFVGLKMFSLQKLSISSKYWKYALVYNLPLIPHYLAQQVLSQSDRIMISNFESIKMVGIYSLGYSAGMVLLLLNQSILNTYTPWVYQKIKQGRFLDIAHISYIILILIALGDLLLIIIAPELVIFLAPESYYGAKWVIPPVAMSVYFMFLYSLFSNYEFYYEKTKQIMFASVLVAVLNIMLNYLFIPICGYIAAAYTTLLCYVLYSFAHYFFMRRILQIKQESNQNVYNMSIISVITVLFVVLGFGSMSLYNNYFARYLILLLIIILVFCYRKRISNVLQTLKQK